MQSAIERYESACRLLPGSWQAVGRAVADAQKRRCEEFRLRVGQPLTGVFPEGERILSGKRAPQTVSGADLEHLCDYISGYSRYAVSQTMAQGYLTAEGGFRVGLCGTAVSEGGRVVNLRDLSSATIRIGRELPGIAEGLLQQLWDQDAFASTLVLSPPGGGKTTLLRDLIRLISSGTAQTPAFRVGVCDERGELAGMYCGAPQFDIGTHTDVLDCCPKAQGTEMLLRTANPQIIAVDEITAEADVRAVITAANCGTALLATAHGASVQDVAGRPLYRKLLKAEVFHRVIVIERTAGQRTYRVEKI